ncbi:MAG TPA: hypothetical protein VMH80_23125 [Bryobacteraceae bacterium]|nr:hypothetical protein [Bryobacteraceae bacterium]
MNLILCMFVISIACFGICVWLTPALLRKVAAKLLTRADVIDAAKLEHQRRLQFWYTELGVPRELDVENAIADPVVPTLARN